MPTRARFDCFEVDLASGQLRKNAIRILLRQQCFQILASLLERPVEATYLGGARVYARPAGQ